MKAAKSFRVESIDHGAVAASRGPAVTGSKVTQGRTLQVRRIWESPRMASQRARLQTILGRRGQVGSQSLLQVAQAERKVHRSRRLEGLRLGDANSHPHRGRTRGEDAVVARIAIAACDEMLWSLREVRPRSQVSVDQEIANLRRHIARAATALANRNTAGGHEALMRVARMASAASTRLRNLGPHAPLHGRHGTNGLKALVKLFMDIGAGASDVGGVVVSILKELGKAGHALVTAFSTAGYVFGGIGLVLGGRAIVLGHQTERRLKDLVDSGAIKDKKLREVAGYAKNKQRIKKLRGGVTLAIGTSAILAAALASGFVGVGLGSLFALVGVGLVLWKWWHKRHKRSLFQAGIPGVAKAMLQEASMEGPSGHQRALISSMGLTVSDWNDARAVQAQEPALERALAERVGSRRKLMARSLVVQLIGGDALATDNAGRILAALGVSAEEVQRVIAEGGVDAAIERVADKMRSW